MRVLPAILLVISAFSLSLGVTQPLLRFERLIFFDETPSLVEITRQLWASGDLFLSMTVIVFSFVFPAAKIIAAQILLVVEDGDPETRRRIQRFLGVVSKWSMMDVLLVALLIFAAKTSGLADAFTQPGLWFYALSVATAAIGAALIREGAPGKKAD